MCHKLRNYYKLYKKWGSMTKCAKTKESIAKCAKILGSIRKCAKSWDSVPKLNSCSFCHIYMLLKISDSTKSDKLEKSIVEGSFFILALAFHPPSRLKDYSTC